MVLVLDFDTSRRLSCEKLNVFYVCLMIELCLKTARELGFDISSEVDLDPVIEENEFKRADDQRLLIEDLNQSHENFWS
jgi:hypothetical protein